MRTLAVEVNGLIETISNQLEIGGVFDGVFSLQVGQSSIRDFVHGPDCGGILIGMIFCGD